MNYAKLVTESEDELTALENKQALVLNRDRLRFLKVLKTEQVTTQNVAGEAIGIGQRQAQRLWKRYRTKGLADLLMPAKRLRWGKLSSHQISHLRQFLCDDQAQTLEPVAGRTASGVEPYHLQFGHAGSREIWDVKRLVAISVCQTAWSQSLEVVARSVHQVRRHDIL